MSSVWDTPPGPELKSSRGAVVSGLIVVPMYGSMAGPCDATYRVPSLPFMVIEPASPPHNLAAFSRMPSSTVVRSPGCSLISASTSLVAVWSWSASSRSLKRPALRMAMAAWSAKVCRIAACFSSNGRTSVRLRLIWPIHSPSILRGKWALDRTSKRSEELGDSAGPRSSRRSGPRRTSARRRRASGSVLHWRTRYRPHAPGRRCRPPPARDLRVEASQRPDRRRSGRWPWRGRHRAPTVRSPGFSLISSRISLVAVCSSKASASSVLRASMSATRRALVTALPAWAANDSKSSISSGVNGSTVSRNAATPTGGPSAPQRGEHR